jgi:hypothetical protein
MREPFDFDLDTVFEYGLQRLLDGIETRRRPSITDSPVRQRPHGNPRAVTRLTCTSNPTVTNYSYRIGSKSPITHLHDNHAAKTYASMIKIYGAAKISEESAGTLLSLTLRAGNVTRQ